MNIIVFVHGLGGSPSKTWGKFLKLIKSDPSLSDFKVEYYPYPTSIIKILPWTVFPKIQDLADGLRAFIKVRTTLEDKVTIVTHSMGGLIARKYLVDEIKNNRKLNVRKLLLYATPNKGSKIAKLSWLSRIVQVFQMKKKSDLISDLNNDWKAINVEKYVQVKFVVAGRDKVVDADSAKYYWNSGDIEVIPFKSHKNIVKPLDENDDTYLIFKKFVFQRLKFLVEDYEKPKIYIPRKIIKVEDFNSFNLFYIKDELQLTVFDTILKFNKVTLLAGAGEGKTKEVENLVWMSYTSNLMMYPIKVNLKYYTGGLIEAIFPEGWKLIPDDQLLLVLDGLDEVESSNIKSAIKSIEHYSEQHPETKILITCRTNFYLNPSDSFSGTMKDFEPFYLLKLDWDDIDRFVSSHIKNKSADFLKQVYKKKLEEIIRIPFYLINLTKYYNLKFTLPDNIVIMFDWLLEIRLKEDIEHFRTTYDLENKKKEVISVLEKIALAMETLGRNYAHDEEINKILNKPGEKELLNYSGLINNRQNNWEFEHNNFQEFLTAKILSKQNLDVIKNFISFFPDFNRIIPSWTNTLSFLASMYSKNDLLEWLLDIQPEALVKFEIESVPIELRIRLFKEIFNHYKSREIWIDGDKYDFRELGKFASDEESIDFLINEANTNQYYVIVANAIELLGYVSLSFKIREKTFKLLLKIIQESNNEVLITRSLNALIHQGFSNKSDIENILQKLDYSQSAHIRSCLYHLINSSEYNNEYVEIYLNGIKYIRFEYKNALGRTTLIDEGVYLARGIEEISSEDSVIKLLEYFIKNPKDLTEVSFRDRTVEKIAKNVARLITKSNSTIFKLSIQLFVTLGKKYLLEHTKKFLIVFVESNTVLEIFKLTLYGEHETGLKYRLLSIIANNDSLNYVIEQYNTKKIDDNDIRLLINYLGWENNALVKELNYKLKKQTAYREQEQSTRNFEYERKEQRNREIEMFYDMDAFAKEINLVFEKEKKQKFTSQEIRDIEIKNWEDQIYAYKALNIIEDFSKESPANMEKILSVYNNSDFELLFVHEIYTFLTQNVEFELEEKYKQKINEWCYNHANEVDFKTALIIKPNKQRSTSYKAPYLQFFLQRFNLNYPEDVLLDLLSFDFYGGEIEYLEERISLNKIKDRIIEDLQSGKENEVAINNYYQIGKKHHIHEIVPFAFESIKNSKLDSSTRKSALELVAAFDTTTNDLEQSLLEVKDEFKWEIVEVLIKRKSGKLENYLLNELKREDEIIREKASIYLIELQNIEGLKYFYEKIKKEMKYMPKWYNNRNSLRAITNKEAVPYLLKLLELTYKKEFVQKEYDRLEREIYDALTSISLQSSDSFNYVKEEIEKFIKDNTSKYEKINFNYAFLERLEQKYYINKSQNVTIDDVVKKMELIYN